jgi:hypothetical protein
MSISESSTIVPLPVENLLPHFAELLSHDACILVASSRREGVCGVEGARHAVIEWGLALDSTPYLHYDVNGEGDCGWGCAYRCLQCLAWSFTDTRRAVPIVELQTALERYGRMRASDIGTKRWIEPPDGRVYLTEELSVRTHYQEVCVMSSTGAVCEAAVARLRAQLWKHFGAEGCRTPWMCDDSIQAFVVAGIAKTDDDVECVLCVRVRVLHRILLSVAL